MGVFFTNLPCGGRMIEPDRGEPSFQSCGDEYCVYCGRNREFAKKFREYLSHFLLPIDGWGDEARTKFGIVEVANHIVKGEGDFRIGRNHNFTGNKNWYNIEGTITLPFSVLVTEDELVDLQALWLASNGAVRPVDQNLDHPNAPKPE